MSTKTYDVLIAGAGPVGLFLACELALAGDVSVLVLERESEPFDTQSPWKTSPLGTRGINTLSAETFWRRGLLEQVLGADEWRKRPMDLKPGGMSGHFAGMMFDATKVDRSALCWKYKIPGPSLCPSPTTLGRIIDALYTRAKELGVEILEGVDVTGVTQDEDRDEVVIHTGAGQSFHGRWVVGCDGGRSKVRKAAGFDFVGTEPELMGYTVLCNLDDPRKQLKRGFTRTTNGVYMQFMPGHISVMEPDVSTVLERNKPVTKEEFEAVLRRVTCLDDVSVSEMQLASTFTDRSKQATTYQIGRVLLAGDSAHIHGPLGGQGLNAGIGDAMNLGWKLAAVAKGTMPPSLLDTYTAERHPVGAWVTEWTRAQVATLKPDLHGQAVANLIKDLINTCDGTTHMTNRFWGLSQRYDLSTDDIDQQQQHPLVGCSAPDFEFMDGSGRLGEALRSGRGLLINFEDGYEAKLSDLTQKWHPKVDYVGKRVKDAIGLQALLIRPDGVVAWVAESKSEPDLIMAEKELLRWFGPEA